jgi:hypothetical protein
MSVRTTCVNSGGVMGLIKYFGTPTLSARVDEECVVLASIFWTCSALEG